MFIVMGATGHVGSAVVRALLETGATVTGLTRDEDKAAALRAEGAEAAVVDVDDVERLRAVFRGGARAFLLNPPAAPTTDTDQEEARTVRCIMAALQDSGLERVVVESTYGAQPGERCGDLNILHDFEQALREQPIPAVVQRAAYYMSNWDMTLPAVRSGALPTFYPADLAIPMVAPVDLGRAAAGLLTRSDLPDEPHYVEGPERYSSADVAAAFAEALGRPVEAAVVPPEGWEEAYRKLGFSAPAAASYARMTAVTVEGRYEMPEAPERGAMTLRRYVADLVARDGG